VKVSKVDAARRQLETAVTLYFHEGDPVSIHTLTCAAYEVLRRINKGTPMIKDWMKDYIKPEYVKKFGSKLNEAQNFFKHADRDAEKTLTFEPRTTHILLLDACWAYKRIAQERLPLLAIFEMWAATTWGKHYITVPGLDLSDPEVVKWASLSRQEFFNTFVPVAYAATVALPAGGSP